VKIAKKKTADVSSTPKPGMKAVEPQELKPVELEELRAKMAATIERAKAEDPRELQKELADVKRRLANMVQREEAALKLQQKAADSKPEKPTEPVLTTKEREQLAAAQQYISTGLEMRLNAGLSKLQTSIDTAVAIARQLAPIVVKADYAFMQKPEPNMHKAAAIFPPRAVAPVAPRGEGARIGEGELKVLTAIAQHRDAGVTREQITVLTGFKRSTRDAYVQRLKAKGLVDVSSTALTATAVGFAALGSDFEPLPKGEALRGYWLQRLPEGERKVFECAVAAYPQSVSREFISQVTEYKRSTRDAYLQRLKTRRLLDTDGSGIVASPLLFD
jgi:acetolactate synthase small subunit